MATSIIKNDKKVVGKYWSNKSLTQGEYTTMASFNVPAGARVVFLGQSGNGIANAQNNMSAFSLLSGTAKKSYMNRVVNNGSSGNFSVTWAYIEAETACEVVFQQFGYAGGETVTNANGKAIAIVLDGHNVT